MGGVESDSITLDIINKQVDRVVLVSEEAILRAMQFLYEKESLIIEGAGAVTTATIMENVSEFAGKKVVLTLSGGNISEDDLLSLFK